MAVRISDSMRSKIVDSGIVGAFGTGILKIYGGSQPVTGGGNTTQGVLVQISGLTWSAATNGTANLSSSCQGSASTSGTATWGRLSDTSGTGYIVDGVCGTSTSSDFVIDSEGIESTSVITITTATIVQPAS